MSWSCLLSQAQRFLDRISNVRRRKRFAELARRRAREMRRMTPAERLDYIVEKWHDALAEMAK